MRTKVPKIKDASRTKRALAHLERLQDAQGRRLLVDLDADANVALDALLEHGYGATNKAVVNRALIEARSRVEKD
jgi:hypothetical protein